MATKAVVASDVSISHLEGFTYPDESEENALFESFFQDMKEICVGGHLYVSPLTCQRAATTRYPCDHKLIDVQIYPYEVIRIGIAEENDQRQTTVNTATTSKTRTKVSLEPLRSTSQRPFADHVLQFFHTDVLAHPEPPLKGQTLLRIPINARSGKTFSLSIDFNDSDWQDHLRSALTSYSEHCRAHHSPESLSDIQCDLLRCLLPYVEGKELGTPSYTVLLDCSAEPSAIYSTLPLSTSLDVVCNSFFLTLF